VRLGIHGAIHPLPLFAFVACVGTTSLSPYFLLIPRYVQCKQTDAMISC